MSLTLPRLSGFRSQRLIILAFSLCALQPVGAIAGPEESGAVVDAVHAAAKEQTQSLLPVIESLANEVDKSAESLKQGIISQSVQNIKRERIANPDLHNAYMKSTLNNVPESLMVVDMTTSQIMENRLKELSMIAPNATTSSRAGYLIDPTREGIRINAQIFDIFMRYFCDPAARNGSLKDLGVKDGYKVPTVMYWAGNAQMSLGCGSVRTSSGGLLTGPVPGLDGASSRDAVFGAEPATPPGDIAGGLKEIQRNDIKNLPTRPQQLFFDAATLPIKPISPTDKDENTNALAPVYYGAFAQALQYMIGTTSEKPGVPDFTTERGKSRYLESQGAIARKMLASYPFALLFSERVGSMSAQDVGRLLSTKVEAIDDSTLLLPRATQLMNRESISLAEYMDIMMYRVPMSPGYLKRINKMSIADLQREKVWLTAMQNVLNYQRNRWLEILVALEAVK